MATREPKQRRLEYMALDAIPDAPTNAKAHAEDLIDSAISRFRFVEPPVLDERTGKLVSGHGRRNSLRRMKAAGLPAPEGVHVDAKGDWHAPVVRGWASTDDADAEATGVALNRSGEVGGWHNDQLVDSLKRLAAMPAGLTGVGFDMADLAALIPEAPSKGELLTRTDVTVAEPTHVVEHLQVYKLGTHHLVIADVMTEHHVWAPLLTPETLFIPYPGPYVPLSERAELRPFVMVQPDHYIAGHILDKWVAVRPDDAVTLL